MHPENQIDINDYSYIYERFGSILSSAPCPIDVETGKVNPHVSQFKVEGSDETVSVFHVKPVYYEHVSGAWRPLYEVTAHYGNHSIIFEYSKLSQVHPRFIEWLQKRTALIGGSVTVTSPFTEKTFAYGSVVNSLHRMVAKPTIGLTTTTVYPDPHVETTTFDGAGADSLTSSRTFANARADTIGNYASDSGATMTDGGHGKSVGLMRYGGGERSIIRAIALFDTSALGDTDTINSATLSVYGFSKVVTNSGAYDYICIVSQNPSSNIAIANSDFDNRGSTKYNSTDYDISSSFSTTAYNDMALNSTGLSAISKTGVSKFGFLIGGDFDNVDFSTTGDGHNAASWYASDETGTTKDPKLVIVHTASSVNVSVSATVLTATFSLPASTVTAVRTVSVASTVLTATFSTPALAVTVAVSIAPTALSATFSLPTYDVQTPDAYVAPSTLALTVSVPVYTATAIENTTVSPSVLSATFSTPSYTLTVIANITIEPSVLACTFILPSSRVTADFWSDTYATPNTSWSDKFSTPSTSWSDKY